jgi:hypothetical protein
VNVSVVVASRNRRADLLATLPRHEAPVVTLDLADAGWLLSYVDDLVVHHHPSPSRGSVAHRRTQVVRAALLTACMRRPWREVLALATSDLRADGPARLGVLRALPSLPGALTRRRRISPWLQHRLTEVRAAPHRSVSPESARIEGVAP